MKYLKINSADNKDGNDLFNAIAKDILRMKPGHLKEELGLPSGPTVTTKDVISVIQEKKLKCTLTIEYDDSTPINEEASNLFE